MATDIGGVWRTVGGRRIFIKDGEDLETAMKKSGKFKEKKENYELEKYGDLSNPDNYINAQNDLVFKKGLSVEESEKILGKFESKDTFKTLEEQMNDANIKLASDEEIKNLQKKANKVILKLAKAKAKANKN